ncbi:hypothetical protein EYF80_041753 [Liparis tanakae]|uniref:Uncharacterized protein n=1 Tax=Liparis tanakae TaxID=230148 RepID=A0A4Z2G3D6_9TELE|nr:hypothetical protein EYF80_041753 [Liparis tanakae]
MSGGQLPSDSVLLRGALAVFHLEFKLELKDKAGIFSFSVERVELLSADLVCELLLGSGPLQSGQEQLSEKFTPF